MQSQIIAAIDKQIAQLQKARAILAGSDTLTSSEKRAKGRQKSSQSFKQGTSTPKRVMSAEGRARIAAAQKKRWAASKRAAKKAAAEAAQTE